jgi:hypothetical protein
MVIRLNLFDQDSSDSDLFDETFGIPLLISSGQCDSCFNTAKYICADCNFSEHCQECIDKMMSKSKTYNSFMDDCDIYTCIFCFVELQADELGEAVRKAQKSCTVGR